MASKPTLTCAARYTLTALVVIMLLPALYAMALQLLAITGVLILWLIVGYLAYKIVGACLTLYAAYKYRNLFRN